MSGDLHRLFLTNGSLVVDKWAHYFDIYERHLGRFRGRPITLLEIGVFGGGSLAMWRDYFGSYARIVGLDLDPECKRYEGEGIDVVIGRQEEPATLDRIVDSYPQIDIVIDDGSHVMSDMIASFEHLYPRMSPHGCYIVEDTHTCYWDKFGGGVGRAGTFMEFVKDRLDDINAVHARGDLPVTDFTRSTQSISVYDSVVVFEKRPQGARQRLTTRAMPAEAMAPPKDSL